MFQKALKDRVVVNRCSIDAILWFHLECPKAAAAFDDPDKFRLKMYKFFKMNQLAAQLDKQTAQEYESDYPMTDLEKYQTTVPDNNYKGMSDIQDLRKIIDKYGPKGKDEPEDYMDIEETIRAGGRRLTKRQGHEFYDLRKPQGPI